MLAVSSLLTTIISFYSVRLIFRDKILAIIEQKSFFKMILDLSKRKPWLASFMIRFTYVTPCYKNYFSAIVNMNFIQFFSFGSFHVLLLIVFDLHIGRSLKSLDQLDSYNIFEDQLLAISAIFYFCTITYTVIIFCFLGKKTIDKTLEENEAKEKEKELCDEENATQDLKDESCETTLPEDSSVPVK